MASICGWNGTIRTFGRSLILSWSMEKSGRTEFPETLSFPYREVINHRVGVNSILTAVGTIEGLFLARGLTLPPYRPGGSGIVSPCITTALRAKAC
jgi:hypothetical protein